MLNPIGGRYESRVILVIDRENAPMKLLDTSEYFTETDLSLLKNLSNYKKLELIAALSSSMTEEQKDRKLDKTSFSAFEGDMLLKLKKPFAKTKLADVAGCLRYRGEAKTLEDMELAIAKGVLEQTQ